MKKVHKLLSCLLAVALLCVICVPAAAVSQEEEQQIRRRISSHYYTALASTGEETLKGLCGTQTSWQLYLLGINQYLVTNNGNEQYDYYASMKYTTGGYKVRTYPAREYTMTEALYAATDYGQRDAYNLLVGFQRTNTEAGAIYGHAVVIYAILDGMVYFTEGFSTSFGGVEGQAMVRSIPDFVRYYHDWTQFEGLIEFGKKDRAYTCVKHPADCYGAPVQDVELYSQPCADPASDSQIRLLRVIPAGERVHIIGVYEDSEGNLFYCVSDNGNEGFVPVAALTVQRMCWPGITVNSIEIPERIEKEQSTAIRVSTTLENCDAVLVLRDSDGIILDSKILSGGNDVFYAFQNETTLSQLEEGSYSLAVIAARDQMMVLNGELMPVLQEEMVEERYFCVGQEAEPSARSVSGNDVTDGWNYIDGQWFYYKDGAPHVGWLCDDSGDYYLQEDGSITTGWAEVLGKPRYFSETGVMRTGWLEDGSDTYYLMCNGVPAVGWREIDGSRYYFDENGRMLRNTWMETEKGTYCLQLDGTSPINGWYDTNKGRQFFDPDGFVQWDYSS